MDFRPAISLEHDTEKSMSQSMEFKPFLNKNSLCTRFLNESHQNGHIL